MVLFVLLLISLPSAAQTPDIAIGPIVLGEPLPSLAICPISGWENGKVLNTGKEICLEKGRYGGNDRVWNVPYDYAKLSLEKAADGSIESIFNEIEDEMCEKVLQGLKAKFGDPTTVRDQQLANGFGARWHGTEYLWIAKNGQLGFSVRIVNYRGCLILARSAAKVKAGATPEVKF
jgi:hypothetical protein